MGQSEDALKLLDELRSKYSENTQVLLVSFDALSNLDRFDEAVACLDEVVSQEPGNFTAHFQRAQLLMQLGRVKEGEKDLRAALVLNPEHARANAILSELKTFTDADDADKQAIEGCYQHSVPESSDRVYLCNALGKVFADLQEYDRSFVFYEEGNAIRKGKANYDADAELSRMEAIISYYTPEVLRVSSGLDDERPVFIVGMPRCGSTLVEQILAAHPDCSSRGEWEAFELAWFNLHDADKPLTLEEVASYGVAEWEEVGQAYLDRLDEGESGRRITDKTLGNIRMVGAIHCALPQARIIHVRRNPLDTCLSIYTSNIQGQQFDFGLSQGTLGYYYRMYQRLMQHWREVLPEGTMYELDYEQLVTDQEEETRKLLEYCGLEWNDACLNFQQAEARVKTASILQVRKSLYTSSVERWRRYEKHLQPLIRILGTG
jgi:tetratricopeptide (TPR) repeat protein